MRRTLATLTTTALLAAGLALAAPTSAATTTVKPTPSGWTPRAATYGTVTEKDVAVTMSDGVVLKVDVVRPALADGTAAPGRFPVILNQTPYNKNAGLLGAGDGYLVERGYVMVVADVRGTGSSGGQWASFDPREQKDGLELSNWATSKDRPWSNGTLGLWGVSYSAINQFFTAAQHPKGLKAIFPIVPAGDVYRDVVASGGQIDAGFIPLWLGLVTATGVIPPATTATAPDYTLLTLLSHVQGFGSFQAPTVAGAALDQDPSYDGDFYRVRSPLNVVDKVNVPTFIVGGEYDIFQRGEPLLYQALAKRGVPSRLVIGPWTHVEAASGDLSASGLISNDALALRWFDRYLRGASDPRLGSDIKPVTYYELGTGRWRTDTHWLGSDVKAAAYRLGGTAKQGGTVGTLGGKPADTDGDTLAPVPVSGLCTRSTMQWTAGLAQTPTCSDDNQYDDKLGLSYETPAMTKPLDLLGPINAETWVSTTGSNGMLAVQVEDVAPDGSVKRLTGGWQVFSLRALDAKRSVSRNGLTLQPYHPFTKASEQPVTAGTPMKISVDVFPTGARIDKGHRLRVTFASYDTPHLVPNVQQVVGGAAGVVTVMHSAKYPSRLVLPVR